MSKLLRRLCQRASGLKKTVGPSPTTKQRLVDATKSLLDIANESVDTFPPLKSCLGCINALVKYYEGCKDIEDKLGDLVVWLTKLRDSVATTSAEGNREEAKRRERLARSLAGIEKRSKMLLKKGKGARFLDKRRDSGMVVKLVEELEQAILLYQLSQQRSIDNRVAQLASSFGAFLKLHKTALEVKERTESTLARLGRLTVAGSDIGDEGESKRKMILTEALGGIEERLLSILERTGSIGYQENDADVRAVGKLAEDVRDAVIEYQLGQQSAIHEQNCRLIDSADLSVLNNCRRAQAAEYCHSNRRGCLRGTRDTVLHEIESWADNFRKSPVFWLNGLVGTGKTTIAQTIAERLFAEGRLGASFFCSRDFEDRSDLRLIFPTLAFQLAHKYPNFRSLFVSLLRANPDVVHESLHSQMQKMIVEPLRKTGVSTVLVIDALDECKDHESTSAILSVLARFVEETPKVKFFITGRPEPRIKTGFRLPLLIDSTNVFVLHDVDPSLIESDIRVFLTHELFELAQRRQLEGWLKDKHIELLCRRAAGLFVYAVATIKFLDSNTHLTEHRLDVILKLPESTAPEGKTRFNPRTTLDSLYTSILQTAFSEEDSHVDSKVRTTVGTVLVVVNPLPPLAIAQLIGLELKEVMLYLTLIQSLLAIGEDSNKPVKPFHKSFPDFITDPSRCLDTRFYISPPRLHFQLTTNCLRLMNDELEQDLLSLPEHTLNSKIKDLQARINGRISIALQYACRSWHNHLTETKGEIADVISYLQIFLETKFLAWLEVLSVLGDVGSASVGLEKLMRWLQEVARDSRLLDTTQDCFNFVTKFFEPISVSATHIYHSALELCPSSSIVRRLYYDRCHGITRLPRVVIGTPDSWDSAISFSGEVNYGFCTWSPCGRFVAARTGKTVEIRNQLTFELLTALQSTHSVSLPTGPLAYSPDGRSLACGFSNVIVIWDIQTGGVAKEIVCPMAIVSLVWSLDGMSIATTQIGKGGSIRGVETYDAASGVQLFVEEFEQEANLYLWAYEKSFRLMEAVLDYLDPTLNISIFEIGPTLHAIESFGLTIGKRSRSTITFSPSTYHISILGIDALRVFDIRTSECLLGHRTPVASSQFSPDGSLFAAFLREGLHVWKCTAGSYTSLGEPSFRHLGKASLQFSPTSSTILSWHQNVLHVLRMPDFPTAPETYHQSLAISRSGTHIATAHKSESVVTIIDLHSQVPSQFIDTGMDIRGLAIIGNVLLVEGKNEVVGWRLTEGGTVFGVPDDRRAGDRHSIWNVPAQSRFGDHWILEVGDQVGAVKSNRRICPFIYHIETGDILELVPEPQHFKTSFSELSTGGPYHHLRYPDLPQHDASPEDGWLIPYETTPEAAWVVDPEGRYSFWVPVEWRRTWDYRNWHHDITTLFSNIAGQSVVIKF